MPEIGYGCEALIELCLPEKVPPQSCVNLFEIQYVLELRGDHGIARWIQDACLLALWGSRDDP